MDQQYREYNWREVERAFAENKIPMGTPCSVVITVKVRTEEGAAQVRAALQRDGFQVMGGEKKWWPFGRRWQLDATMPTPRPIARDETDRWLDLVEDRLKVYDAEVAYWTPLRPGA